MDKGALEGERNQLQSLALALKEAVDKAGATKKVAGALAGDKMLQRLWDSL